jgi:geranylgeranyl diphosphate synthase type II
VTYKEEFSKLKNVVEDNLDKYLPIDYPNSIFESMRYSVLAGGKRLRPVIVLEVARILSGSYEQAIPTACAVEMLHTQSLIHDDLPCMDNDDLRRGKMTCHIKYGEGIALLAGDCLLNRAYEILLKASSIISFAVLS